VVQFYSNIIFLESYLIFLLDFHRRRNRLLWGVWILGRSWLRNLLADPLLLAEGATLALLGRGPKVDSRVQITLIGFNRLRGPPVHGLLARDTLFLARLGQLHHRVVRVMPLGRGAWSLLLGTLLLLEEVRRTVHELIILLLHTGVDVFISHILLKAARVAVRGILRLLETVDWNRLMLSHKGLIVQIMGLVVQK
jgi:hypothetical protein